MQRLSAHHPPPNDAKIAAKEAQLKELLLERAELSEVSDKLLHPGNADDPATAGKLRIVRVEIDLLQGKIDRLHRQIDQLAGLADG